MSDHGSPGHRWRAWERRGRGRRHSSSPPSSDGSSSPPRGTRSPSLHRTRRRAHSHRRARSHTARRADRQPSLQARATVASATAARATDTGAGAGTGTAAATAANPTIALVPPPPSSTSSGAQAAVPVWMQPSLKQLLHMRRPDKYDGSSDYHLFRVQFLQHAAALGWDEETKGRGLAQALSGKALQVLRHLPPHLVANFETLDDALKRRHGHTINAREQKLRLRSLKRVHDQTLTAFATIVEDTTRGAYPDWAESQLQAEMADIFIANLNNETLSMLLRQQDLGTLSAALQAAEKLAPSPTSEDRDRNRARVRQADGTYSATEQLTESDPIGLDDVVQTMNHVTGLNEARYKAVVNTLNTVTESVHKLTTDRKRHASSRSPRGSSRSRARSRSRDRRRSRSPRDSQDLKRRRSSPESFKKWLASTQCYGCRQYGHTKRYCRAQPQVNTAPVQYVPVYLPAPGVHAATGQAQPSAATRPGKSQAQGKGNRAKKGDKRDSHEPKNA